MYFCLNVYLYTDTTSGRVLCAFYGRTSAVFKMCNYNNFPTDLFIRDNDIGLVDMSKDFFKKDMAAT